MFSLVICHYEESLPGYLLDSQFVNIGLLQLYRFLGKIKTAAVIRTTVNTNNAKEMLNGVFSDEVGSKCRGDTGLRQLVVALNGVIWINAAGFYLNEKLLFLRYSSPGFLSELSLFFKVSPPPILSFFPWNFFFSFVKFSFKYVVILMPPLGRVTGHRVPLLACTQAVVGLHENSW